jgi:hypothetical protein
MLVILGIRLCLQIRIQDVVRVKRLIIIPLKGWKSSNIWAQPQGITILFREQFEVWERLLSFGAESFVLQSAIQKCKD